MILNTPPGSPRQRLRQRMVDRGLDPDRLDFVWQLNLHEYFNTYNRIDVALDPFPYTGGTTTCDSLFMGVPVVSLAGTIAPHRGGATLLTNAGLPEFVATSRNAYINIALSLAENLPRLSELRARLRAQFTSSPVFDSAAFMHDLQAIYRTIWRRWCES